jgi:hypothetical protein
VRYEHDCANCTPLIEWGDYDLYHCTHEGGTVIARYSNEHRSYHSGIPVKDQSFCITPLGIAYGIAIARKLAK